MVIKDEISCALAALATGPVVIHCGSSAQFRMMRSRILEINPAADVHEGDREIHGECPAFWLYDEVSKMDWKSVDRH
jgi:hypothetical protein